MNVPNHSQASQIRYDIQKLQNGETPRDWQGNSYAGVVGTKYDGPETQAFDQRYTLIHWQTPIAQVTFLQGEVVGIYFNARYISSTTRGFQGRIRNALATALGDWHPAVRRITEELGKKTHQRDVVSWEIPD